jgi:hypothetical protein
MRTGSLLTVAVLAAAALLNASVAFGQYPGQALRRGYSPKVMYYDYAADEFEYAKSVLDPHRPGRPAGDLGYHGNRLTQFTFIGPPEMAGIYGAMQDYKIKMRRDPMKHQYRWEGYSR